MGQHLKHALLVAGSVVLAGAAAWLVSPGARSLVDHHPAVAVYLTLAAGLVDALRKAVSDSKSGSGGGGQP